MKPKPTQENDALSEIRASGNMIPLWAMLGPVHDNLKVYAAHVPWVPLSMRDQPKRVEFPSKALGWVLYMGMRRPRYMWMIDPPPGIPTPKNTKSYLGGLPARRIPDMQPIDIAQMNGGYCKRCGLLRRLCAEECGSQ